MEPSKEPILYGVFLSQPVRAVAWLMVYKRVPFQMLPIIPGLKGDMGSRSPEFRQKSPAGMVPALEDPSSGFAISESHAIMTYLCNLHNWVDLYPSAPELRAKVDWYLNFHHRYIRPATIALLTPRVRVDLQFPPDVIEAQLRSFKAGLKVLEEYCLNQQAFVVGEQLSLADFSAYAEIGQLKPEFANLFDFSPYPNVKRWMAAMTEVEGHDEVHAGLIELGDLRGGPASFERMKSANKRSYLEIKQRVAEFRA